MKKLTIYEMVEDLYKATYDYTTLYCLQHEVEVIDKQIWAGIHFGYASCMKTLGYSEDEVSEVISAVIEKLKKL